jgi:hypothetical protein
MYSDERSHGVDKDFVFSIGLKNWPIAIIVEGGWPSKNNMQ